jgi:hypothetical protein
LVAPDSSDTVVVLAPKAEPLAQPTVAEESGASVAPASALDTEGSLSELDLDSAVLSLDAAPAQEESLHSSRFTIKGGYYSSEEDALDDGFIFNLSWMTFTSKMFATEFEIGYIDADGSDGGTDSEMWSIPVMVNGRLNLKVWVLDLYGGLGIGGFYNHLESDTGNSHKSTESCLFGGNAFLGATINLADAVALGLEGKYYITDEVSSFDTSLDAFALMLTLGFSR